MILQKKQLITIFFLFFLSMSISILYPTQAYAAEKETNRCSEEIQKIHNKKYSSLTINEKFKLLGCTAGFTDPELDEKKTNYIQAVAYYLGLAFGGLLAFIAVLFTVQIIRGGYFWLTAGGNEEKVNEAKETLRNAAMGLGIVVFLGIMFSGIIYIYLNSAFTSMTNQSTTTTTNTNK